MKILLVIPIFNPDEALFGDLLKMIGAQSVEVSEIVIINSGKDIKLNGVHHIIKIEKDQFNHADTRNIALNFDADFYMFMTQDALPADRFLVEKLLTVFEDKEVVASYARQIPYKDADIIEQYARGKNYPDFTIEKSLKKISELGIKAFFCSNSCSIYKRDYFINTGGFKSGLSTNEDMEFAARAILDGKKIFYVHDGRVFHSHNHKLSSLFVRYMGIGKFFKQNSWIIEAVSRYCSLESTGVGHAMEELKFVWERDKMLIPKSIIFSFVKYLGYKIGRGW